MTGSAGSFVKLDTRKLEEIQRELKKKYQVKVGILADDVNRKSSVGENNALLGAVHEFGSAARNIPSRSFLRMPLHQKMPEKMMQIGQGLLDNMTSKNIKKQYSKLGFIGENIVSDAFQTGGFGQWAQTKYSTIMRKLGSKKNLFVKKQLAAEVMHEGKTHTKILVDTTQLMHSISSKVEEKKQ